jgi:hypothetical protein
MENNISDICVLCGEDNNLQTVTLSSKGCVGLIAAAKQKGEIGFCLSNLLTVSDANRKTK